MKTVSSIKTYIPLLSMLKIPREKLFLYSPSNKTPKTIRERPNEMGNLIFVFTCFSKKRVIFLRNTESDVIFHICDLMKAIRTLLRTN